jgi:hypothetical protein
MLRALPEQGRSQWLLELRQRTGQHREMDTELESRAAALPGGLLDSVVVSEGYAHHTSACKSPRMDWTEVASE